MAGVKRGAVYGCLLVAALGMMVILITVSEKYNRERHSIRVNDLDSACDIGGHEVVEDNGRHHVFVYYEHQDASNMLAEYSATFASHKAADDYGHKRHGAVERCILDYKTREIRTFRDTVSKAGLNACIAFFVITMIVLASMCVHDIWQKWTGRDHFQHKG